MTFLFKIVEVRLSKEIEEIINTLKKKYPELYGCDSDVLRAGVYALNRWTEERYKNYVELEENVAEDDCRDSSR